tara:strand:- start:331 stop:936 length:606 start_codon:yes stop_codon:yes gene_type:complete
MGAITRAFANNVTSSLGTGDFVHIKTLTAGGVSSLDFINGTNDVVLDSTYNVYKIIGHRVDFGATKGLACRFRVSSSFVTSGYETTSSSLRGTQTSYDISGGATSNGYIRMGWQRYTGTTTGFSSNFEMTFYNLPSTSKDKHCICMMAMNGNTTDDAGFQFSSGTLDNDSARTNAVDGLRFAADDFSTNISGSFALYGLKE